MFWCGDEAVDIDRKKGGNVFDLPARKAGYSGNPAPWDDGYRDVAPVGCYAANPFGLYDVIGNADEWCEDEYFEDYASSPPHPDDGDRTLSMSAGVRYRVVRGGGWTAEPVALPRSAARQEVSPTDRFFDLGCRPARAIVW
jgi:formylglycine-generating enzyme required for sulfatase activity